MLDNKIPKIIHYCWFGRNPLPSLAIDSIASWKKHLPEYQIMEWNEDNFPFHEFPFAQEALDARKFAFVSDVCRLYALKKMGGVYMDTDVEVIKSSIPSCHTLLFLDLRMMILCQQESWQVNRTVFGYQNF